MSLVTIITVTFNAEKTLESTIQSVLKAKLIYKQIDYIIIDGCSHDGTINIIEKYKDALFYWRSEPDMGIYDAMNKGWEKAKDSYILFLGAGDEIKLFPNELSYNLKDKIVCYGNVNIGNRPYKSQLNYKIRFGNTFHHQALLVNKNFSKLGPFDTSYKVYGDYELNIRLLQQGYEFVQITDFSVFALPDGLSSTIHLKEILGIVKVNFGYHWAMAAFLYYIQQAIKHGYKLALK